MDTIIIVDIIACVISMIAFMAIPWDKVYYGDYEEEES